MKIPRQELKSLLVSRNQEEACALIERQWTDLSLFDDEWEDVLKDAMLTYSPMVAQLLIDKEVNFTYKWASKLYIEPSFHKSVGYKNTYSKFYENKPMTVTTEDIEKTIDILYGLNDPKKQLNSADFWKLTRINLEIAVKFAEADKVQRLGSGKGLGELKDIVLANLQEPKLMERLLKKYKNLSSYTFVEAAGSLYLKPFLDNQSLNIKSTRHEPKQHFDRYYGKMKELGIAPVDIVRFFEHQSGMSFFATAAFLNNPTAAQDVFSFASLQMNEKTKRMLEDYIGHDSFNRMNSAVIAVAIAIQYNAPVSVPDGALTNPLHPHEIEYLREIDKDNVKSLEISQIWKEMFAKMFETHLRSQKDIAILESEKKWRMVSTFKIHKYQQSMLNFFENFVMEIHLDSKLIQSIEQTSEEMPGPVAVKRPMMERF